MRGNFDFWLGGTKLDQLHPGYGVGLSRAYGQNKNNPK